MCAALGRRPAYAEFVTDHNQVIGGANLEESKAVYADQFVQRSEFLARYPANLSSGDFVDGLLNTTKNYSGVDLSSQRAALVDQLNQCLASSTQSHCRAVTLRQVADNTTYAQAVYNSGFVLMQYLVTTPRHDQTGYDFGWVY